MDLNKPFLQTARCHAYTPQLAHLDDYAMMLANLEFIRCYGVAYNREQADERLRSDMNHWERYGFGPWMWYEKESEAYVGRAGLKTFHEDVELTYSIRPEYWGKGIAYEMSLAAIAYAFNTLHLKSLICFTRVDNQQSLRVMEKLGFQYETEFMHANLPHTLYRLYCKNYLFTVH